jgi:MFS family permease
MPSSPPPASTPSLKSQPSQDAEKATYTLTAAPNDLSQFGPAPDGGTKAWLNAFGGFCIFFGCLGFTSCFGVLQEYYSTHQLKDLSASQISWIGSLSSFIQFSGGAIGGPMFDRYGVKVNHFLFIIS